MADYTKTTNFTAKDNLASGNPSKLVLGADHDTEYDAIETAVATKANKISSPVTNDLILQSATGDLTAAGYGLPNVNADITASDEELNLLDGATVTTAEINILDGVTSTTAELNILDGVTATTAEINKLDGVTATTAELNLVDGLTATTAELNKLDVDNSTVQTPRMFAIRAVQGIDTSTTTDITGYTERYDTSSDFNTTTGVYTPSVAGWYKVTVTTKFASGSLTNFKITTSLSGTLTTADFTVANHWNDNTGATTQTTFTDVFYVECNGTTDNFKVRLFHNQGTTQTFSVYLGVERLV
jgi:hypothetical protein